MSIANVVNRIDEIQRMARSGRPPGTNGFTLPAQPPVELATPQTTSGGFTSAGTIDARQQLLGVQRASNLASPLPGLRQTSGYGLRTHPVHGDVRMHHGADFGAPLGTPIHSVADGIVTFAGERGGYGNLVIIDHGGGYETRYAHQSVLGVGVGDLVRAGDPVGQVGSTGVSTGPHLHFEVRRDGESIDPDPWLVS